ncbi:alpha/beta fold hydrolase [Streptomyces sp. NPDC057445]|uniref:alpha/beta fold hydrolase n=1 Tax=Streptomyces sp. NPDC057445 TaxID=3346136 RepID=UPI0036981A9F
MDALSYQGSDGCSLHAAALGRGPAVILLHGEGSDHHSLVPLARRLAESYSVVLPDIRGYGRSVCTDPARHTWAQYVDDVAALLSHLGLQEVALGGVGMGGTVTLRAAAAYPQHILAGVVIGAEDVDAGVRDGEAARTDSCAAHFRHNGTDSARKSVPPDLAPVTGNPVRDALSRSDPASIAAACAIRRDRAFTSIADFADIPVPTLIIPGSGHRRRAALAEEIARTLPHGHLAGVTVSADLCTADDLAQRMAPALWAFLTTHLTMRAAALPV